MPERERPSLLYIHSDQHNPYVTGCYGDPLVQTPNLDRLAQNGALFENAYCCSPICVPSRMSMLTGQHPYQNRVWTNQHSLDSSIPTFAHAMGAAGYWPVLVGRMHALGPDHASVGSALLGVGRCEVRLGQLDPAAATLERMRTIFEKAHIPDGGSISQSLGELALARGKPADAVSLLERALAIDDTDAEVTLTLADAVWKLGKDRKRARELAEHARALYEKLGHRPGAERAARWLAEHA